MTTTEPRRTFRALPTEYAGVLFRSRVESRWALFWDAIDVQWEYETQGFDLDGEHYLPDFRLPGLDAWVEVKGIRPTTDEVQKCRWLADATDKTAIMVWSEPCPPAKLIDQPNGAVDQALIYASTWDDYSYWWCECPHCHAIGLTFMGRAERLACRCVEVFTPGATVYAHDTPRLMSAYAAARKAFTGPTFLGQPTPRYVPPPAA